MMQVLSPEAATIQETLCCVPRAPGWFGFWPGMHDQDPPSGGAYVTIRFSGARVPKGMLKHATSARRTILRS